MTDDRTCPCGCGWAYDKARADAIGRGVPEDRVDAWLAALAGVVVPGPNRG